MKTFRSKKFDWKEIQLSVCGQSVLKVDDLINPTIVHLDSPGGNISEAFGLMKAIEKHAVTITINPFNYQRDVTEDA